MCFRSLSKQQILYLLAFRPAWRRSLRSLSTRLPSGLVELRTIQFPSRLSLPLLLLWHLFYTFSHYGQVLSIWNTWSLLAATHVLLCALPDPVHVTFVFEAGKLFLPCRCVDLRRQLTSVCTMVLANGSCVRRASLLFPCASFISKAQLLARSKMTSFLCRRLPAADCIVS